MQRTWAADCSAEPQHQPPALRQGLHCTARRPPRTQCLDHFGYDCQICNFSFSECYGELGEEFCHVHHIEPLSQTGGEGNLDPIKDLIPVCPNCHAMLHRKTETITPDELREILALEGETND